MMPLFSFASKFQTGAEIDPPKDLQRIPKRHLEQFSCNLSWNVKAHHGETDAQYRDSAPKHPTSMLKGISSESACQGRLTRSRVRFGFNGPRFGLPSGSSLDSMFVFQSHVISMFHTYALQLAAEFFPLASSGP